MEKIHHSINNFFSHFIIYYDDLEEIIKILQEEGFLDIEILTKNHKYKIDEIKSIGDLENLTQIRSLKLGISTVTFTEPVIFTVTFNDRWGGFLHASTDSSLVEGLMIKIGKIFKKRERKISGIISKLWFVPALLSFAELILLQKKLISAIFGGWMLVLVVVLYVFIAVSNSRKFFRRNVIYRHKKNDLPNYWIRNKDQITVSIITVIITTPIVIIITSWFNK